MATPALPDGWWLDERPLGGQRRADLFGEVHDVRFHATPTLQQVAFRGRNDDGSQTTATWKANQNTNWSQAVDTNFRVRFEIQESGGAADSTTTWQLQYNLSGAGWNNVTDTSNVVRAVDSTQIADGVATTNQLTAGSGTFVAGSIDEVDGLASGTAIGASGHTEVEYTVQIRSADTSGGNTIQLQVVKGSGASLDLGNAVTPTVTPTFPPATHQGVAQMQGVASMTAQAGVTKAARSSFTNVASMTASAVLAKGAVAQLASVTTLSATTLFTPAYRGSALPTTLPYGFGSFEEGTLGASQEGVAQLQAVASFTARAVATRTAVAQMAAGSSLQARAASLKPAVVQMASLSSMTARAGRTARAVAQVQAVSVMVATAETQGQQVAVAQMATVATMSARAVASRVGRAQFVSSTQMTARAAGTKRAVAQMVSVSSMTARAPITRRAVARFVNASTAFFAAAGQRNAVARAQSVASMEAVANVADAPESVVAGPLPAVLPYAFGDIEGTEANTPQLPKARFIAVSTLRAYPFFITKVYFAYVKDGAKTEAALSEKPKTQLHTKDQLVSETEMTLEPIS